MTNTFKNFILKPILRKWSQLRDLIYATFQSSLHTGLVRINTRAHPEPVLTHVLLWHVFIYQTISQAYDEPKSTKKTDCYLWIQINIYNFEIINNISSDSHVCYIVTIGLISWDVRCMLYFCIMVAVLLSSVAHFQIFQYP